ncbi:hypothetical protein DY262_01440 [Hydrogenophaga borbori]|uniref:Uncharacterized protein n=1 Tax=Hydrogenophaga borbori TaxID=2294117 RepID=A0A372EPR8_9BURK|nr:hypothetical protein DY262_01440 [Hydrogenophaga borbori]
MPIACAGDTARGLPAAVSLQEVRYAQAPFTAPWRGGAPRRTATVRQHRPTTADAGRRSPPAARGTRIASRARRRPARHSGRARSRDRAGRAGP